ncbi:hypothetical protein MUO32_05230 [Shinella sp. CPCC 101442]|uniref:GrlR family regulatory protein n=1 Tax=Shinella sp. CPCC 101442 TaxID=2932265 RepID=UPI002152E210|nr:GrlR family regulatory protein [Shinella sp. CPCC 101442]MCR6498428.1 hypothetical protein [Shinella sp. CPCC 101442]
MRNGLYRVHFTTPLGMGAGVVHAVDGEMWGGDAGIYYRGTYSVAGDTLKATVTTGRHTNLGNIVSVFGKDQVTINIVGQIQGDSVKAKGSSPEAPGLSFGADLAFVCD